ncbi:unnamed protein product [Spodoptera littoralis]|uniref:Deltamethrin resistance protein prag01 domain-containing protein n=1 Tax=Spodoptera littoralis TaxID=7109 RepID=A0A9P0N9A5_SPOLI|nr:unnamed protein product [Spodoptera littoralis]CAH1647111.1 unnamed protein product [Spodoptera littoralis]
MLAKVLGFRRGLTSAISRRYACGTLLRSGFQPNSGVLAVYGNRVAITPTRSYRCDAHMNELPVPCLPWEPWYNDKQSKYNKILIAGILWWLFSFGMMLYTDSIFLNWGPPRQPGPPSDMVEECDDSV